MKYSKARIFYIDKFSVLLQQNADKLFALVSYKVGKMAKDVVAALVAGNVLIATLAANTLLIASRVFDLLHASGISEDVLYNLPCLDCMVRIKIG